MADHKSLAVYLSATGLYPEAAPLIPEAFIPTTKLGVAFGGKAVNEGNFFRAGECKAAPNISFPKETNVEGSNSYTLLLVDPDAPNPDDRKFGYWRHWVVSGLRPSETEISLAIHTKPALTEYLGPGPKDEEPEGLSLSKDDVGGEEFVQRRSFNAPEWVKKHGLRLVGLSWMHGVGDGWKEE